MQRIILDTDIGTDLDDAYALATVLSLPELELLGVTAAYGDRWQTRIRGSLALRLGALAGRDFPVAVGSSVPLAPAPDVYWEGHEGRGLLSFDATDPSDFHPLDAREFLIEMSRQHPGEILLVAIGPLTNLGQALAMDPGLAQRLKGVVLMGGGYRAFNNRREHNFACDPDAARAVLCSGIPLVMVGYNVTSRMRFTREELHAVTEPESPFARALRRLTDVYLGLKGRSHTWLHDPLAVASAACPDLVRLETLDLTVSPRGVTRPLSDCMRAPWQARVQMATNVSVRRVKGFLKPRWQQFFASLAGLEGPTAGTTARERPGV